MGVNQEHNGAFVDLDVSRLDREGLVMLGMKEALDRWIDKLTLKATEQDHQGVAQVMMEVASYIREDRDSITVELTKRAISMKAAQLEKIRKEAN